MPTIDELPQAISVSDADELVVAQSGTARRATRAQLLAGVQAALALPSGTLLGRVSAGFGAPETIALGANLTVAQGTLSAPAAFVIDALPAGDIPALADQVAVSQSGQNAAISYAALMAGLSGVPGIDGANLLATAAGASVARPIANWLADTITVESFGAVGDGVTDDSAAFVAAIATGLPIRLAARRYVVNAALTLAATMSGITGASVICRTRMTTGDSWLLVNSATASFDGVIFDAGGLIGLDMPCVAVTSVCVTGYFNDCSFINATGPSHGSGLSVTGSPAATHRVMDCVFADNTLNGFDMNAGGQVAVQGCVANANGGSGIRIETGVESALRDNACASNTIGVSVGGWQSGAAGAECVVSANVCSRNTSLGIAVAGGGALVDGNLVRDNGTPILGGGILARVGAARLSNNVVSGGAIGIDVRGCWGSAVSGNHVSAAAIAVSAGGSQYMLVASNTMLMNGWGVSVSAIEPDLSGLATGPRQHHWELDRVYDCRGWRHQRVG